MHTAFTIPRRVNVGNALVEGAGMGSGRQHPLGQQLHQQRRPSYQTGWLLTASVLVQESKARSWLLRAVQLAKGDNGDFWALLYKLESQYGNAESQKKVLLLHYPSPQQHHVTSARADTHSPRNLGFCVICLGMESHVVIACP